jgi:hypothetical protein
MTPPTIATGQWFHFCALAILLLLLWMVWAGLGQPWPLLFWLAAAVPVAHQIFVWLAWRLELGSGAVSRTLGFDGYVVIFFILFGGRFVTLLVLAWVDRGTLGLPLIPLVVLAAILGLLGGYAGYSVKRYFGMRRAAGADHFDASYRAMPLVDQGIFRYTDNGMYFYAFLSFWMIAVAFDSSAALAVAGFSHAYIWVHFYATEKPDMEYLYSGQDDPAPTD